jgi:hypothetical protein
LAYDDGVGEPGNNIVPDLENVPPHWLNRFLIVMDGEGHEHLRFPYHEAWGSLAQWADDDRILIRRTSEGNPIHSNYAAKFVVNPFTGEEFELPPDPTDIIELYPTPDWSGTGIIAYNQDLNQRVYPSKAGELVFEDIQSHNILAKFYNSIDLYPEWSPNGQEFVVLKPVNDIELYPSDNELFMVSPNGHINRLTNLTTSFPGTRIYNYTWSPDGQKIAFWLTTDPDAINEVSLAILDLNSQEVIIYSIESSFNGPPPLVWSPDGHQLLVGTTGQHGEKTFLFNLDKSSIYSIADGSIPVGWLVDEP